jgi:hypothetical protein
MSHRQALRCHQEPTAVKGAGRHGRASRVDAILRHQPLDIKTS